MSGDVHVRFCERLGVRLPRATHLVIVCRRQPEEALRWLTAIVERLGLSLNEEKTRVCDAWRESFDFLGYTFGPMVYQKTGQTYLGVTPSKKQVKRLKRSLWSVLRASNPGLEPEVVAQVNRKLEGWANYFSIGSIHYAYRAVDKYACDLLQQFLVRRHRVPGRGTRRFSRRNLHERFGLVSLMDRCPVAPSNALS